MGDTDGFAPRYNGGAKVVMDDGHARFLLTAQSAVGKNWNRNKNSTLTKVTEFADYLWNPRYDSGPQRWAQEVDGRK